MGEIVNFLNCQSTMILLASFLIGLFETSWAQEESDIVCTEGKVCRQVATGLPLRGLPRALSTLYSVPDTSSPIIASNVKAFWPVYIFTRQDLDYSDPANPNGWYQVGTSVNDPWGWMQAKDILEWKQALMVSYIHPGLGEERRNSVLMFKTKENLNDIVEADDREERAQTLYKGLDAQPPRIDDTLISREPTRFVNIEEKFYMLPVIDFEEVDLFDDETRYLQIAAAVVGARSDEKNKDTLDNSAFLEQSGAMETTKGTQAATLGFDIKFVMDMTSSMGPFIQRTKEAVQEVAQKVTQKDMNTEVNYGLIGYRDDLKKIPNLEFVVKNLTNGLVDAETFDQVISTAQAAPMGSGDYQEEVFAGVKEGIESTWNDNAIKFIVLIGDASSHLANHPQSTTGMNDQQLRDLANTEKVFIIAVHLKEERAKSDHPLAQAQFSILATNPGSDIPAYLEIAAEDHDSFETVAKNLADTLAKVLGDIRTGDTTILQKAETTTPIQDVEKQAVVVAQMVAANALIDYLGSVANPPKDIIAWVMDRDLTDPETQTLQVRVLLKKRELNDLIKALEDVLKAVKRSQLTSMQFFDALQGVVTQSTKGGGSITLQNAQKLADSDLLPSWINSLPYRSSILEMNNELFEGLSAEERSNLEYEIESKLQLYQEINENTDLWVALDERDASIDHVYPLPLSTLP